MSTEDILSRSDLRTGSLPAPQANDSTTQSPALSALPTTVGSGRTDTDEIHTPDQCHAADSTAPEP
ncbi:hypothetical protein L612_005500000020 [Rhodococcus rhodochrous J38]|nr:hypothetical protein L612_005500000020 [Rhodococcus rhodochrous J38]